MTAILNSAILDSAISHKKNSLIHADSTWWWQPSWILPSWIQTLSSWIQTPCYLLSDSLKNTLTPLWLWLKLIQSDSNSFILTQIDDGSYLEFCHLGLSHLSFSSQTHSHLPRLVPTICTKKTSLIHSDSTWWWQPSWILPSWIQLPPCWIQTPCYLLSDSLKSTLTPLWLKTNSIWLKLIHSHSTWWWQPSWILPSWIQPFHTQKNFTHSCWLNLMMAAILNSAILDSDTVILDSDTLLSSLRFTQKHSHSTLTLTQTNSIWLKLIHSHSNWWWQPSWILPSWIWPS